MFILGIIIASIWFGVGVIIAWGRARNAYQSVIAQQTGLGDTRLSDEELSDLKAAALFRAAAIFYGWAVAGLIGAVLWFIFYVLLIVGREEVKAHSKSRSKQNSTGGLLVLLGLMTISLETLYRVEWEIDDLIIKLGVVVTCLVGLAVAILFDA